MPKAANKSVRAVSAYQIFISEKRPELCKDARFGESSSILASAWKEVPESEREEWKTKAALETTKRVEDAKQDPQPGSQVDKAKVVKQKRKPSAFLTFSKTYRSSLNPNLSFGDKSKQCGIAWKQLPEEEKESWKNKASLEKDDAVENAAQVADEEVDTEGAA